MLFSRYGQGEIVLNMPFLDAIELINYANLQRLEGVLLNRWIVNYEQEMSFTEFKQKLGIANSNSNMEEKKVEDILLDLKESFG